MVVEQDFFGTLLWGSPLPFLISLLGNVYGLSYWKQADHPGNGRKLRLFYGLLNGIIKAAHGRKHLAVHIIAYLVTLRRVPCEMP